MRGGTTKGIKPSFWALGLSPHARGNHKQTQETRDAAGPIPACAGEPLSWALPLQPLPAYPRMRGGTLYQGIELRVFLGLSPHARGNLCPVDR